MDPRAFRCIFGRDERYVALKCAKNEDRKLLRSEIRLSGIEAPLGGEECAEDIVTAMDLVHAERNEPTLAHFIRDLRSLFKR